MLIALRSFLMVAALGLMAAPVQAQALGDILSAEVLPGYRTQSGTHMAGIRVRLSHGWKTYWRSPGDAGIPPEFNWSGSENVKAVHIHWPVPDIFTFNGMHTIGYDREVVLPVEIWPLRAQDPVRLNSHVELGVCRDICVPASVELAAVLPMGGAGDPMIRAALRAQPMSARAAGLTAHHCRMEPAGKGMRLSAELTLPAQGAEELVVIETADPNLWVSEPRVERRGGVLRAEAEVVAANRQPFGLDRSGLVITVLAAGRAVEIRGCPAG